MNYRNVTVSLFAFITFLVLPSTGTAQGSSATSMTVIGGDARAQDCYRSAGIAAQIHYTSKSELENCTYALDYANLSLRDRAATLVNRGIIYMALEEYDKAIQDYSTAKRLSPDFGEIYVNVGNIYYLGKLYDKAIEEYSSAIEKNTHRRHVAYFNRGMAYEKLGEFAKAETDYRTVMELVPDWVLPQTRLTELQNKMNNS